MRKLFVLLMAMAAAVAMILPVAIASAASPQVAVNGYLILTTTGYLPKVVGADNTMKGLIYHGATYTGDISGTGTEECHFTYNTDSLVLASVGVQEYTGTILGKTGTLTFRILHQGLVEMGKDGESLKVEQTIVSGTDELANLRGTMHFTVSYHAATGTYEGTYSGKLHFVD